MVFYKTIFPNGLRLIIVPMRDNPTATVTVLVEAGSKYETKKISGASHFLEHMCFKGTRRRPKPFDIAKELDGIGAQYNAFTSQEYTGYFAKADKRHFGKILDAVSDIYLNSALPDAEMQKEKKVIIEEIKMYQDLPPRHISDLLLALLYGDQPAGWDVAGTPETVSKLSRAQLFDYRTKHYVSGATAVLVAGNVSLREAKRRVEEAFASMNAGRKHPKTAVRDEQKKPAFSFEFKKTDQVHLALGVRALPIFHRDCDALRVLTAILGGGMSSRLFQRMREALALCYYVRAESTLLTDHGFMDIAAGVPLARFPEALSALVSELRLLKEKSVSAEELARVKEYLIGNLYLGLEASDSVADFYGAQEILRRPLRRPEDVAAAIRAVTAADITRLAQILFVKNRLNLAAIGELAKKDENKARDVLESFYA